MSTVGNSSTFVSSYYQLDDATEILSFMDRKGLVRRETDSHWVVKECPFCHPTRGKVDNLFKLYIHKSKGVYKCHRCGAAGSWFDFKQKLQGNVSVGSVGGMLHGDGGPGASLDPREAKVISVLDNQKAMAIQRNLFDDPDFEPIRQYLIEKRGISEQVLMKYGVGAIEQPFRNENGEQVVAKCISFPWMARQGDLDTMGVLRSSSSPSSADKNQFDVIRLKIRALEDKSQQRLVPKGGSWGLFGWNTVPTSAEEIVVTEGEFDAMAVYQATGMPAVSLPNGCQSLPPNVLPLLERFKKIYLWMDNDAPGQASVEKFATKLGITRCFIVRPPADSKKPIKDANDALLAGADLKKLIHLAEIIPHDQIATFEQLRRDVYEEIVNPIRACGVQSRTLPSLNRLLKGHRLGEVTILTGPTGCGKTTLLSQLSLDLCGQGVNTLWGSFEIKNTRLIHKMLTQLAGKNLRGDVNAFEAVADKFEALPMYFLRFFGSTDVDEVLDAMEYAVYAYDVQHILLDNVQFMMAGQGRGYDKFERQDAALDKFRKFASQKNVHLTLVIHPRKEQEDVDLTLTSVFGTAKATQEADNVLILQRTRGQTKLDVRKNRFDGTLGSLPLMFDADSNCLKEYGQETMDENVASIHLEAEMQLEQKIRQQRLDRETTNVDTPSNDLHVVMATPQQEETPVSSGVVRFEYTSDEYSDEAGERVSQYSLRAMDDKPTSVGVNGSASSYHVNGVNGINGVSSDDEDRPNGMHGGSLNGSSSGSGRLNGSGPSRRGPNGTHSSGGEPFSAFTPIITR
ncbi:hypothetical protein Poli38472_004306 [Pythium oligandrum]|uniref:SF4 helicase domain-containing protein n=1 Tax=Pythium oligandrum TaxID=41045 RepID=A0A8K1FKX8_PYTOL|nr:hypothetical protein Poli38472_004306 [Pythium oligandrum]|eukprot:TMW66541.1 hypothetical protein Poli38472_004306 [Pythium oligandrum]